MLALKAGPERVLRGVKWPRGGAERRFNLGAVVSANRPLAALFAPNTPPSSSSRCLRARPALTALVGRAIRTCALFPLVFVSFGHRAHFEPPALFV